MLARKRDVECTVTWPPEPPSTVEPASVNGPAADSPPRTNVSPVVWALKQTAGENGYGRQLGNAALIGLIGGVLVFAGSMLLFTVFPNYLEEFKTAQIAGLEQWNLPEDRLEAQIAQIEAVTPVRSSLQGAIGTLFTSLIVGAIVAIFQRKKG